MKTIQNVDRERFIHLMYHPLLVRIIFNASKCLYFSFHKKYLYAIYSNIIRKFYIY